MIVMAALGYYLSSVGGREQTVSNYLSIYLSLAISFSLVSYRAQVSFCSKLQAEFACINIGRMLA